LEIHVLFHKKIPGLPDENMSIVGLGCACNVLDWRDLRSSIPMIAVIIQGIINEVNTSYDCQIEAGAIFILDQVARIMPVSSKFINPQHYFRNPVQR